MAAFNVLDVGLRLIEVFESDTVLQTALGVTDSDKRVYQDQVPRDYKKIHVFFGLNSSDSLVVVGGKSIGEKPEWQIKVVGRNTGYGALAAAATRLDYLLENVVGNTQKNNTFILPFVRQSVIMMPYQYDDETWYYLGRTWRQNCYDV